MATKEIEFYSNKSKLRGVLFYSEKEIQPGVLFFLGGGKNLSVQYFKKWQKDLLKNGISSFSFEYRGLGKSERGFEENSLEGRLEDGKNALKAFLESGRVSPEKICVLGNSMGAHVAARMVEEKGVKCIILSNPAAYSKKAENKRFNKDFTNIIREKNSWKDSYAFDALSRKKIPSLILSAENDAVIPGGVIKKYIESLGDLAEVHTIPSVPHKYLDKSDIFSKKAQKIAFKLSIDFLKNNFK